jgi:hypothetical protein
LVPRYEQAERGGSQDGAAPETRPAGHCAQRRRRGQEHSGFPSGPPGHRRSRSRRLAGQRRVGSGHAGLGAPPGSELARLTGIRLAELISYQDEAYAARYLADVERVRAVEGAAAPGSTALAEAVAVNLHKLLSYKTSTKWLGCPWTSGTRSGKGSARARGSPGSSIRRWCERLAWTPRSPSGSGSGQRSASCTRCLGFADSA